ncbi:hypothetical protein SARC_12246 [Sphaeroforma arctica JP610]|uniref:Uncharacterized protein n=1 Tax=Sphaeroforma arctica JP610 TaxID=667725 RepID=A0A0L0FEN4_9EUKA|nr:hypothetical protein SARC_12246 [Sphaeroforma arctica JP610]KNC75227.1 hypothetical protein SARC_12246 [Sphaeroforma arctica JP610]|eukprot:XP_014149129.1 hypothetical protein SARC_12246 [Sphaeroforma arctica JP610]
MYSTKGSETIAENNEDTQIENDAQKSKLLELEESESDNQKETNLTHLIGSESNVKVDQSSGEGKKKSSGLETNIGSAGQATDGADFGTVLAKLSKSDYGSMNTRSKWDLGLAVKAAMYQIMSIPLEVTDLRGNLRLTAKIRVGSIVIHASNGTRSLKYGQKLATSDSVFKEIRKHNLLHASWFAILQ